jgi:hypothetical protein
MSTQRTSTAISSLATFWVVILGNLKLVCLYFACLFPAVLFCFDWLLRRLRTGKAVGGVDRARKLPRRNAVFILSLFRSLEIVRDLLSRAGFLLVQGFYEGGDDCWPMVPLLSLLCPFFLHPPSVQLLLIALLSRDTI